MKPSEESMYNNAKKSSIFLKNWKAKPKKLHAQEFCEW
jgi:hypothetical protein